MFMTAETNLSKLLKTLRPVLNEGEYVFCLLPNLKVIDDTEIVGLFKEKEGNSVVITKQTADTLNLSYTYVAAWITLSVHSSLEAVGLTAAFSAVLANEGISCNVIAGYYHDHIFVSVEDARKAIEVLEKLSGEH